MIIMISVFLYSIIIIAGQSLSSEESLNYERVPISPTRRILKGHTVTNRRPYMVYLRATPNAEDKFQSTHWLCGGVIIDKRFILTSAACVEDAKHFQVISGTHKWVAPSDYSNECVNNGAKKAIWKCVPKSYFFDGEDFDNIRWMVGDIAIIKVEDEFNFEKKIRGCDFIPKKIKFNNISTELEKGGTLASIAGWGSTDKFSEIAEHESTLRTADNSVELQESTVVVVSKKTCRNRWEKRYHSIINDEMICTKDSRTNHMSNVCKSTDINCKGLEILDLDDDYYVEKPTDTITRRRMIIDPAHMRVHTAAHQGANYRRYVDAGGFCENDHGGPLISGHGISATVIGIMSACLTNNLNHKCSGPFLFTSVFKYRKLIACATGSNHEPSCANILRSPKYLLSPILHRHGFEEPLVHATSASNMEIKRSLVQSTKWPKNKIHLNKTSEALNSTINKRLPIGKKSENNNDIMINDMIFETEWRSTNDANFTPNHTRTVLAIFPKITREIEKNSSTVDFTSVKPLVMRKIFPEYE